MSFLYRTAVTINRKQPYIDWANSFDDDGPKLTVELGRRDAIYLVSTAEHEQTVEEVVAEWWEDIFEEELASWMRNEEDWPADRTREMFDLWFDASLTDSVFDLTPDEPLTDDDVDEETLQIAVHTCAWCEREFSEDERPRIEGFRLNHRERLEHREGRTLTLPVEDNRVVIGIVTLPDSEAGRRGDDLVFRVCNRECGQPIRKLVPPALRQLLQAIGPRS